MHTHRMYRMNGITLDTTLDMCVHNLKYWLCSQTMQYTFDNDDRSFN